MCVTAPGREVLQVSELVVGVASDVPLGVARVDWRSLRSERRNSTQQVGNVGYVVGPLGHTCWRRFV